MNFHTLLFLLFFLLFEIRYADAQQIKVLTDKVVHDIRELNRRAIAPVFKYQSDTLLSFKGFGVKSKEKANSFVIKLPDMRDCQDTAYTYLYFGSNPNSQYEGYSPFIIGNYRRGYKPAIIWSDRNFNGDFRDDGPPETLSFRQSSVNIHQQWPQPEGAALNTRLYRPGYSAAEERFKRLTDEYYNRYAPPRIFAGTLFSFLTYRETMKAADVAAEGDSFSVILHDMNANGRYNDAGTDRLITVPFSSDTFQDGFAAVIAEKGSTYIEWNLKSWEVKEVDETGKFVVLSRGTSENVTLTKGKRIPKFKFQLTGGQWKKIKKYRRKPVYLYFWSKTTPEFETDTMWLRKIQEEYGHKVNLITLNYRDNPTEIESFVEYFKPSYQIGFSSANINRLLRVETLPSSYSLRKRLRFEQKGLSPREYYEKLKEKGVEQSGANIGTFEFR